MAQVENIYVIGAGGHGKVVIATLCDAGHTIAGVFDDNPAVWRKTVLGYPILGPAITLAEKPGAKAVLAIGNNAMRHTLARQLAGVEWFTAIHPSAYVHPTARLGPGTVVFAGAILQPDIELGCHCIVNTAATVDHDCRIGDFVHLAPGVHLAGAVSVGSGTLMGIASSSIPGVRIGRETVIGAGAVVVSDIPDNVVAVGVPAMVRTSQP